MITIGERITWTHVTRHSGRSMSFSTREAGVIYADERNITVKYRGNIVHLRPDRVRKVGETTELTEMILEDAHGMLLKKGKD